jgi:dolichyl-phosphate-mannose--protein O-mannosyl transferase
MRYLAIAGFFVACASSVKWTGLSFLGIIILFYLFSLVESEKRKINLLGGILSLVVIPIVFYFFVFTIHFWLLNKTGSGDHMNTPEFQKTLIGSGYENDPEIKPLGYFGKFVEENSLMYSVNEKMANTHAYSSKWYSWPFLGKPILYWMSSEEKGSVKMFLIGNPVVWWSSFLAVLITLGLFFAKVISKLKYFWKNKLEWIPSLLRSEFVPLFILTGFLVNWVSFVFIHRFMLVYHYFPALAFSILALGYIIDKITKNKRILFWLYFEAILFFLILFTFTQGVLIF